MIENTNTFVTWLELFHISTSSFFHSDETNPRTLPSNFLNNERIFFLPNDVRQLVLSLDHKVVSTWDRTLSLISLVPTTDLHDLIILR